MRADNGLVRFGSIAEQAAKIQSQNKGAPPGKSFDSVFKQALEKEKLVFSKHAEQRIREREISLTAEDIEKLDGAARRAEEKGVKNGLILMDDKAFIVNIRSGTVITAMDKNDMKESVFTQIDGAVMV